MSGDHASGPIPARLGLRENLGQFSLLLLINAFVGTMVGMERSTLPLLAEQEFGIASRSAILSFLIAFGLVKAFANTFAGRASDRWGRRRTLLAGWVAGLPVPLLIMYAPSWGWIVAANVLLGVNQGLCWSTAIIMKVDLAGSRQRGLAIGLNESSGYLAVAAAALGSGYLAAHYGMRPAIFVLGMAAAIGGLLCSWFTVETGRHVELESARHPKEDRRPSFRDVLRKVSWSHAPLRAVSQAGLVNNLNDGVSWGLFPLLFAARGASIDRTAWLVAIYPAVWAVTQLLTGPLSDRIGRRPLISIGMIAQGIALVAIAAGHSWNVWLAAMVLFGVGTGFAYPTLLGAVSDHSRPSWRATAIGVYRWWRDIGYAVGAILAGFTADRFGIPATVGVVAGLTIVSGLVVAITYRDVVDDTAGISFAPEI